jgi:peroxiredoxin Q/BCP
MATKTSPKKAATKKAATTTTKAATKKPATATKAATTTKTSAAIAPAVATGAPAPAFSLAGDDGQVHSLQTHRGRPIVLYFYPKDDTPGCTVEACDFRDHLARATAKGAVVLGVSRDDAKSHQRFRTKFSLNFPLLSDPDLAAHRAYGAWGPKVMYGREVEGTIRSTFLIDGEGVVRAAWPRVKVAGHVDEVLQALEGL